VKISVVGAGNVANHLAPKFYKEGHTIHQVCNRGITKARKLAKKVNASAISDIHKLDKKIDLVLIMVSDDAISIVADQLAKRFRKSKVLIAHTSGSISSKALKSLTQYGVFYPLQTFVDIKENEWSSIPILITANNAGNKKQLKNLAESIGLNAIQKSDKQRKALHLSAVIMNNFINHLFCMNNEWLDKNKSDFSLLLPLINKTISNAENNNACNIQTGPAKRNDQAVIEDHLQSLKDFPELKEIYKVFSQSIQNKHS